jgi:protein-S-isoprenylcysteine O-methyltransferase Ste14
MTIEGLNRAIVYAWVVLAAVWLVAAAGKKPTLRRQAMGARLVYGLLLTFGFVLMARPWFRIGLLAVRFVPDTMQIAVTAFSLVLAGAMVAIWARLTLGGNWSGRPSLMAGHELITRGPYAFTRHPIYTGLLLAFVGTALAVGEVRGIVALGAILAGFLIKIGDEEKILEQAFPEAYPQYRQRVKALIPWLI